MIDFAIGWGHDKAFSELNEHLKDRFWADLVRHGYVVTSGDIFDLLWTKVIAGRRKRQDIKDAGKTDFPFNGKGRFPVLRHGLYQSIMMEKRMSRLRAQAFLAGIVALGTE
jgi:hypothetical protein